MQKRVIIVPIVALGIIAIVAFNSVKTVSAHGLQETGSLASRFAERFNMDQSQVEVVLTEFRDEHRAEHEQERQQRLEERLTQAVADGKLTESQQFALLEKHEEMQDMWDELEDLSPEERHERMADFHEELEAWAQEEGIDIDSVMRFQERMGNGGMRGFRIH